MKQERQRIQWSAEPPPAPQRHGTVTGRPMRPCPPSRAPRPSQARRRGQGTGPEVNKARTPLVLPEWPLKTSAVHQLQPAAEPMLTAAHASADQAGQMAEFTVAGQQCKGARMELPIQKRRNSRGPLDTHSARRRLPTSDSCLSSSAVRLTFS